MTTWVYEAIPAKSGGKPRYFEFEQSMSDKPLAKHSETGEPIRRVAPGGFGVWSSKPPNSNSGSSCGPGCGRH